MAAALTSASIITLTAAFGQEGCGRHEYHHHDEYSGEHTVIHVCKCEPGFDRVNDGACIATLCAQAFMRLNAAQEGVRHSLQTLRATYTSEFFGRLLQNTQKLFETVRLGELWRLDEYYAAMLDPNSGLDKVLADLSARPVKDDATWEAIKNLNTFRRLVNETRTLIRNRACDH
ncbi:MAG TPA: hypothetical protein VL048_04895 [Xanthobacteraceae bacterium]|nr:hypothetical protein [Xanthobacteraceae bacterium]